MKSIGLIRKLAVGLTLGIALAAAPIAANAGVFISVGFAPPALPVYTQPICPGDGYLWNPGYWNYGPEGYYWVPGVWVQPPSVGLLWTPGYWGWGGSAFIFHEGYWGPHVGFYGGINYGFGYGGSGFFGGRWEGGHFAYNTSVVNVNRTVIHNTYVENVHVNNNFSHTSFNGGNGGIQARPSAEEARFEHENHVAPTSAQMSHVQAAHAVPGNFAKANGGHPAMAAIQRPGAMNTAVAARGAQTTNRGGFGGQHAANQPGNSARPAGQPVNQRQNSSPARPATNAAQPTRSGGFGQTAQRPAQTQAQTHPAAQSRPQPAPRAQAAPRPANHGGEHPHR